MQRAAQSPFASGRLFLNGPLPIGRAADESRALKLRRIKEIDRFQERLAEVVDAASISEWLEKPNPAFGDPKALEAYVNVARSIYLWTMIFYLESGVAS